MKKKTKPPYYWHQAKKFLSKKDKKLAKIINKYDGYLVSRNDPFYSLCRSIIGQQISVKAADSIWLKFEKIIKKIKPINLIKLSNGEKKGINTHTYTTSEIQRVARVAFQLARKRNNKVTSCEKSNVMEAGLLWREEVEELHKKEFKDVELSHMLADNCAMQLVRNPKQFDVIVTDNLFGDMLSDEAGMLTGSLGMLPSASLSSKNKDGKFKSMYEPCHGSAPDIAGKNIANPLASILSFSMALRYSFNMDKDADMLDKAVKDVLSDGYRTADIMESGKNKVSTSQMGDLVITKLK